MHIAKHPPSRFSNQYPIFSAAILILLCSYCKCCLRCYWTCQRSRLTKLSDNLKEKTDDKKKQLERKAKE